MNKKKDVKEIIEKNAGKILRTAINNMEDNPAIINKLIDKIIPKDREEETDDIEKRYKEYIEEIKKLSLKIKDQEEIQLPKIL